MRDTGEPHKDLPDRLKLAFKLPQSFGTFAMFLGAGAAKSQIQHKDEQLPIGGEVRDEVLEVYYEESRLGTPEEHVEKFKEDFRNQLQGHFDSDDPTEWNITPEIVWTFILEKHGRKDLSLFAPILYDIFELNLSVPPAYRHVAWLLLNQEIEWVATTNFDEKIDQAVLEQHEKQSIRFEKDEGGDRLDRDWRRPVIISDKDHFETYQDRPYWNGTSPIIKLHGTISHPRSVQSSMESLKKLAKPRKNVLEQALRDVDYLIFIGYRAYDDDIRDALKKLVKEVDPPRVYWIDKYFDSPSEGQIELIEAFNNRATDEEGGTENQEEAEDEWDPYEYMIEIDAFNFVRKLYLLSYHRVDWREQLAPAKNFLHRSPAKKPTRDRAKRRPVHDRVYGTIKFDELVADDVWTVVDSADFQRLRDITQLSFAKFWYPGATHSRFSHSLGVAYLISLVGLDLRDRGILDDYEVRDLTMAALVHDIGHGPFGHVLDKKLAKRPGIQYVHEQTSREVLNKGIFDLDEVLSRTRCDAKRVEDIIAATDATDKSANNSDLWYSRLLGGYGLDFDRLDFLVRDFHSIGYLEDIPGSRFNLPKDWRSDRLPELITNELCESVVRGENQSGELVPAFKDRRMESSTLKSVLGSLLDLYVNMYENVYLGTPVFKMEHMIAKALELAIKCNELDPNSFYRYTDSDLMHILDSCDSRIAKELLWSVKFRKPFQPVHKFDAPCPDIEVENEIKDCLELNEANGVNDVLIVATRPLVDPTDDENHLYVTDGESGPEPMSMTPIIESLKPKDRVNRTLILAARGSDLQEGARKREIAEIADSFHDSRRTTLLDSLFS